MFSEMGSGTKKGQFGLVYVHKTMMEVGIF